MLGDQPVGKLMRRIRALAAASVICSALVWGQTVAPPRSGQPVPRRAGKVHASFHMEVVVAQANAAAVVPAAASQDPREIVRRAALNDMANDQRARDYTFIENEVLHKLGAGGKPVSTETRVYEFMMLYGEPVRRLIARDGKPLSAKEAAKQEDKINELMRKRERETPEQRQKRLEKYEKEREQERAFVGEVADAYYFHLLVEEMINGRPAWVISGDPRPDFHAHLKEARILPNFRFKVWVDKAECQWVKLDADVIDTVSFGWLLARLYPGSRLVINETRVNNEVWLPEHVDLKLNARLALLKKYNLEEAIDYSNYRKFRADSHIVSGPPVQPR